MCRRLAGHIYMITETLINCQKRNGCFTVSDLKRPVVTDLSLRGMILPTGRMGRGTLQAGGTSVTSTSSLDDDPRLVGGK